MPMRNGTIYLPSRIWCELVDTLIRPAAFRRPILTSVRANWTRGVHESRAHSRLSSRPMRQLKTYIIEDSPVIRENLIATLEELGPIQVVGSAADEPTAVQWMGEVNNPVDLVIVDIFLKIGSGLGVLKASQAFPKRHHTVVLSNYATPDMRRKCLHLGADRVFDKSTEIDALLHYACALASGGTGDTGSASLN